MTDPTCGTCAGIGWITVGQSYGDPYGEQNQCPTCWRDDVSPVDTVVCPADSVAYWVARIAGLKAKNESLRAALTAARTHHRTRQTILRYSCYYGECNGHGDDGDAECPLVEVDCCAACLDLAQEINDEIVPDRAMADSCPVLLAIEALDGAL